MFTIEQISKAHGKVRSGADFPKYITEIKELGVINYEAFVSDGHVVYHGENGFVEAPGKYETLPISNQVNLNEFKAQLLAHQQGKTDYLTFIKMCAKTGIEKWMVNLTEMTCTYFDQTGEVLLVEEIPQ